MKAKHWYIKFPLDAYALGPVHFEKLVNQSEVRRWARDWDHLKRLPIGFSCWPVSSGTR